MTHASATVATETLSTDIPLFAGNIAARGRIAQGFHAEGQNMNKVQSQNPWDLEFLDQANDPEQPFTLPPSIASGQFDDFFGEGSGLDKQFRFAENGGNRIEVQPRHLKHHCGQHIKIGSRLDAFLTKSGTLTEGALC